MNFNKVSFFWKDKQTTKNISNIHIIRLIDFLESFNFYDNDKLKLQSNNYNSSIVIDSINDIIKILELFESYDKAICYLEINKKIVINNKFTDFIMGNKIIRNIKTFHQNSDTVREDLYTFITNISCDTENLMCIGGEMYIFPKLIKYLYCECYSDFSSIVDDCSYNNKPNVNLLINYKNFDFNLDKKKSWTIINNRSEVLGNNLISQLLSTTSQINLILIVCKDKIFQKEFLSLNNKFKKICSFAFSNLISVYLLQNY